MPAVGATQPLHAARVLQNEYYTWLNKDRHATADNVLFSERSARIARNMHLQKKAYQEAACLDCHSTNVPAKLVSGHIDPEDGVQCEACHGPSSGWRAEHTMAGWTHEQSVARGMTDLRSISTRGTLCLSCHLGNAKREVDHELIASGHPILAFELDNYTETMPDGMPGRDQLMIDLALGVAKVAGEAERAARGDGAEIGHAARYGLLVRPAGHCVLGAPAAGGTEASFTLHSVFRVDMTVNELRRYVGGVAAEAD